MNSGNGNHRNGNRVNNQIGKNNEPAITVQNEREQSQQITVTTTTKRNEQSRTTGNKRGNRMKRTWQQQRNNDNVNNVECVVLNTGTSNPNNVTRTT
jgi:hypothetical protein